MATQLAPAEAEIIPPNDNQNDDGGTQVIERDYDAEAKAQGWTDLDKFKGDPSRWVDAETFIKRADEVLPLIKKENRHLRGEIDQLKKMVARVQKSEQAAYDNALADLKAKMEVAVERGDVAGFRKLGETADKLREEMKADTPKGDQQKEAVRAFATWRDDNEWYDLGGLPSATETERKQRAYFDRMVEANQDQTETMAPAEFISFIGGLVDAKYPAGHAPRAKGNEAVAGVTRTGALRNAKTGANLPGDAKDAVRRYMRQGIYKGKTFEEACNVFAKDFDWSAS